MGKLLVIPLVMVALLGGALVWSGGSTQRRADFASPAVLQAARDALDAEQVPPGFLADAETAAWLQDAVEDDKRWAPDALTVEHRVPADEDGGDARRMRALLAAMKQAHERARPAAAGGSNDEREKAQKDVEQIETTIHDLNWKHRGAKSDVEKVGGKQAAAARLREQADDAERRRLDVARAAGVLQKEVDRLESRPAGLASDEDDPELRHLQATLKTLNDSLAVAREASGKPAGEAKTAMEAAEKQFDAQVTAAQEAVAGNELLAAYLAQLQVLQTQLRLLNEELVQEQKDQRARLDELQAGIKQKAAERIQSAWDANPQLKELVTRRAVKERQHNVAAAERQPEAEKLRGELKQLDGEISALRDLIALKDEYDPVTKQFMAFVEQSMEGMARQRRASEARLATVFEAVAKARPDPEKLPAEQKARTAKLEEAARQLASSRAQYQARLDEANNSVDLTTQELVKRLAGQVAAQQAKVDVRKRELADARAAAKPDGDGNAPAPVADEPARLATLEAKRKELAEARLNETRLLEDQTQVTKRLIEARAEADLAAGSVQQLPVIEQALADANRELLRARQRLEETAPDPLAAVRVAEVDDGSVATLRAADRRPVYTCFASLGGLFLVILAWAATKTPDVYVPPMRLDDYGDPQLADDVVSARPASTDAFSMGARRAS